MDEDTLLKEALTALEDTSKENIAQRIILFRALTNSLKELIALKRQTAAQRQCLRTATYDFIFIVKNIREALGDWNLGFALTRQLTDKLDQIESCLDDMQLILLAERGGPSAMIAPDDPPKG